MKRYLSAAVAVFAVPAAAWAADIPAPVVTAPAAPAPVVVVAPPPALFDWSGLYVGANVGYAFGGERVGVFINGNFWDDLDEELHTRGVFGGVLAGYNWQFGNVVAGIEADFQLSRIADTIDVAVNGNRFGIGAELDANIDWFGTVRARLGYAFDRTLVYATGGFAYGHYAYDIDALNYHAADIFTGWTIGAGIEHAFTDNLSARLEYLYVNLGRDTFSGNFGGTTYSTTPTPMFHSVRLAVSYRF